MAPRGPMLNNMIITGPGIISPTLYITVESPVHSEAACTMIMIEASIQSVC